jgi:hypothetical protein
MVRACTPKCVSARRRGRPGHGALLNNMFFLLLPGGEHADHLDGYVTD